MHDKQQPTVLCYANHRITGLVLYSRVLQSDEWIDEDFASLLKPHTMLGEV